jgi:hypothetical protein
MFSAFVALFFVFVFAVFAICASSRVLARSSLNAATLGDERCKSR